MMKPLPEDSVGSGLAKHTETRSVKSEGIKTITFEPTGASSTPREPENPELK